VDDERELDEIEYDFVASWGRMEAYFQWFCGMRDWEWLKPMLGFIAALRKLGCDTQHRAGQSMSVFVLSRSRYHGLSPEQASLTFDLQPDNSMIVTYRHAPDAQEQLTLARPEVTPQVEAMLKRLAAQPID
jgi:hypothetical protein